jgi:hypothetical protein
MILCVLIIFSRTQFPLRLAYAMTINKSQSQGFGAVVIDATIEPFIHGQSYVACSRASDKGKVRMFVTTEQLHPSPLDPTIQVPTMRNNIFHDIIKYM